MVSSYKPFVISEFKTGLFNYLEPWIRPTDAFEPLDNAYVYRGSIFKRQGTVLFAQMRYCNNEIIRTSAIGANGSASGTLAAFPIDVVPNATIFITMQTSSGKETFTSNGVSPTGTLTGSLGDSGTITWATGSWTIQLAGGRSKAANVPVVAHYTFIPLTLTTPQENPIMGIKQHINETTNDKKIIVLDTHRLAYFDPSNGDLTPVCDASQTITTVIAGVQTLTLDLGFANIAPYSISITDGISTIIDTPTTSTAGTFNTVGIFAAGSTVAYGTGIITLNLGAGTGAGTQITITTSLQGDYFNGTASNFFNSVNWQGFLYVTNNIDRVTLFSGTTISRPPFSITLANFNSFTNDITTTLDVKVYKNRLLFLFPTVNAVKDPQSIRWAKQFSTNNFAADVAGNGGELSQPTGDWIQGSEFIRDVLIVFNELSAWIFRFTSNANDPFRFDKINSSKSTNAPYAIVGYDERVTSMGNLGLIACDGVNVQRYDQEVIDLFNDIDQENFQQCYGQRFDQLNQTWMLYVSQDNANFNNGVSDKVIVYNFIENTWSTYSLPLSCLGLGFYVNDITWANFAVGTPLGIQFPNWSSADIAWNSYLSQGKTPLLLGGDHVGNVFILNNGVVDFTDQDSQTDPTRTPIVSTISSTRWNPYIGIGSKTQFGYVDLYYQVNEDCEILVEFLLIIVSLLLHPELLH